MTDKKLKAIVTIGAPASGKSTYANRLSWSEWDTLERDIERQYICTSSDRQLVSPMRVDFNNAYYALDKQVIAEIEKEVTQIIEKRINSYEMNIILSNTNLSQKHREALIRNLLQRGYEVEVVIFNPELDILLTRDNLRQNSVGAKTIVDMWQRMQHQMQSILDLGDLEGVTLTHDHGVKSSQKEYSNGQKQKNCVIVDLDGTIAHNLVLADGTRARGWFDADCSNDEFDDVVFYMAYALSIKYDADIIFLTGRGVSAWHSSKQWLDRHLATFSLYHNNGYQLYSRAAGDSRKDTLAKRDMYDTFIDSRYDKVIAVFDDRPMVTALWHDMGLKVISLGDQRINF